MKRLKDRNLAEILAQLKKHFNPTAIYLFGSRARGNATHQSDYDLLVVLDTLPEPGYRLSQKAQLLLLGIKSSVDLIFMSREKFEFWKDTVGTLPEIISREGEELYAA